jgi:hypothetical protein
MQGMKSLFVFVLIASLESIGLVGRAQAPEAGPSSKQGTAGDPLVDEKSVPADSLKPAANSQAAAPVLCQCVGQGESSATKRIEDALTSPLHKNGIDFAETALNNVLSQVSEEYGIPIQIDRTALDEAGIGVDAPVTINLHNISLRSALKLTFRNLQLTWLIQDEVLMVTTNQEADKHLDTCIYNVQGLVDEADPGSVSALVESIYGCIATDTWAENGGTSAEIRPLPSGLLVVSQTPAVQEQVSALLSKIRKMREKAPLVKGQKYSPEPASGSSSSEHGVEAKKVSHTTEKKQEKSGGGFFSVR